MGTKSHRQKILTRSFMSFMDNDLTTAAAAISYFSMLTLFPTLLLLLTIGNHLFGPETVEKYVIGQVLAFLPGAQTFVRKNLESISEISTSVIVSCVTVMLWAASWMFMVIEKALNRVWGTYPRSFLHGRIWNIAVMSLVWALLAASAVFTAFITGVQAAAGKIHLRLGPWFTALTGYAWQTIFVVASIAVTILLFTVLYKLLPNTNVPFMEALTGAVLAGVLWEGAKFGFAFLLPYFHYDLLYGSIGAGVALLSWVYLSSVIMMFGAQFTALLHRDHLYDSPNKNTHHSTGELPIAIEGVGGQGPGAGVRE
ncbi:MAG TPA: YihY/virulence factor BrkB family protein [Blastocatellia bacterium]|jgi:membrane protein